MPQSRQTPISDDQLARLHQAALVRLHTDGLDGASLNAILADAGVSKGWFYYHYQDKVDLLLSLVDAVLARFTARVGRPSEAADARAFWRNMEAWFRQVLEMARADPDAVLLLRSLMAARGEGRVAAHIERTRERSGHLVGDLLAEGGRLGAFRDDLDADLLVHLALGLLEGGDRYLADRLAGMDDAAVAAFAEQMMAALRRLAAAPEVVA